MTTTTVADRPVFQKTLSSPAPAVRVLNDLGEPPGDGAEHGGQDPGKGPVTVQPSSTTSQPPVSADQTAQNLHDIMLRMKQEFVTEDGSGVDYERLKQSPIFSQYLKIVNSLQNLDISKLTEQQKVAFFINIYNCLTIHGLVEHDRLPSSVLSVQLFWKTTAYNIGGHVFNLDDIMHGILRGNQPHPAARTLPFSSVDPRVVYTVNRVDPRVHFALVCGAKSGPAIQVYSAQNLESTLTLATKAFCETEVTVYEMQREIFVSKIFQWYRSDFGENDLEAIRWTVPYLSPEKGDSLSYCLKQLEKKGMVDITYRDYDWNLNNISPDASLVN